MRAASEIGSGQGNEKKPSKSHRASVGWTRRREQVLNRSRVVAQHVPLSYPEASLVQDDDTARFEWLCRRLDRCLAARHIDVGAEGAQRVEERVDPRREIDR